MWEGNAEKSGQKGSHWEAGLKAGWVAFPRAGCRAPGSQPRRPADLDRLWPRVDREWELGGRHSDPAGSRQLQAGPPCAPLNDLSSHTKSVK